MAHDCHTFHDFTANFAVVISIPMNLSGSFLVFMSGTARDTDPSYTVPVLDYSERHLKL